MTSTAILRLAALALFIALAGCQNAPPEGAAVAQTDSREPADAHDRGEVDTHDHGEGEGSDLDRPVAELFAARCEHDLLTHACTECRYEVGVARVPAELIADGLITTAQAAERALPEVIELPGEIRFDEHRIAHLMPQVTGVIEAVQVELGSRVAAGAALLEIASAELAAAEADYLAAITEESLATRAQARLTALRAAKIASERETLETEQRLAAARITRATGRQRLVALGLGETELGALVAGGAPRADGRLVLRAPFGGEILALHAVRGEQVAPGGELALLGDTAQLWVWVDVYEAQLSRLEALRGAGPVPVRVSVPAYPMHEFVGRLDLIGSTMDETTRTVKSRIRIGNSEGRLRPGMFATVRIALPGAGRALAVPADALLADAGRDFVFVHHADDYFVRRPVQAGRRWDGQVEILAGLAPGQTVAAAGAFLLKSDVLRSKMGAGCAD